MTFSSSPLTFICNEEKNKEETYKLNDNLEMLNLELYCSYPWSRIELMEIALSINDICFDRVHPNKGGIKKKTSL